MSTTLRCSPSGYLLAWFWSISAISAWFLSSIPCERVKGTGTSGSQRAPIGELTVRISKSAEKVRGGFFSGISSGRGRALGTRAASLRPASAPVFPREVRDSVQGRWTRSGTVVEVRRAALMPRVAARRIGADIGGVSSL